MSHHELVKKLQQLQHGDINPRADWQTTNRALLLSQISNTLPAKTTATRESRQLENIWSWFDVFLPKALVNSVVRPVAILLVVALVGTSGWIATVDAAYETLPGEPMYVIKRAAEKTQLAVASFIGGDEATTRVHVQLAKRRAEETKKILRKDAGQNLAQVSATVADLKSEIDSVNKKLDESKDAKSGSTLTADAVRDVKQNTEQITQVLKDVKDGLLISSNTTTAARLLSQEVSEAKDLVKDVSVKAIAAIVEKHLEGDPGVSKEEAKQALNSSLQSAATEVGENKQTVADVKTLVDSAKSEVKDLAGELKKQNNSSPEVASSTKDITAQITSVANQAVAAVLKTEAATAAVDKTISEATALVNSDDLAKAVDKVKEVSQASREVEKISDSSVTRAQTVLPIVQVIKNNVDFGAASSTAISGLTGLGIAASSTSGITTTSGTPNLRLPLITTSTTIIRH